MSQLLVDERCSGCREQCIGPSGQQIRCQRGAADWLLNTCTLFGASLATAHKVIGVWLSDDSVCPTDRPPFASRRRPSQARLRKAGEGAAS